MTETTTTPAPPAAQTRADANAEIRSIARTAGLDQSWIDGQIDGGADPDTARRAAFEALANRSAPSIRTEQVRVEISRPRWSAPDRPLPYPLAHPRRHFSGCFREAGAAASSTASRTSVAVCLRS
jgi:hypothetical protein